MPRNLCLFEDIESTRLLPLVYFRPVYNLRCGILSLKEKLLYYFPRAQLTLHTRAYLAEYMRLRNPRFRVNELPEEEYLFVNGRVVADERFAKRITAEDKKDTAYVCGGQVVAAWVRGSNLRRLRARMNDLLSAADFDGLPRQEVECDLVSYPWDVVQRNPGELRKDFGRLTRGKKGGRILGSVDRNAHLVNRKDIYIGKGSVVKPGVVLDAEEGPIYIGSNARIFPQATIIGPAFVGDSSWVKVGAQIYEGTSIGPVCKVGGEVEGSIIHGYSNKQHGGFLGHAYIGAWVNLGADTNNSDLKNNYGPVKVTLDDKQVNTGLQFVGLTMGDHSKSAINSMFNTGTVVGVSSNIFGQGFPPKYVPSFSWGAAGETFTTFGIDRAIEVARRVMARRKIELTSAEDRLFRKIFELTAEERRRRGMPG